MRSLLIALSLATSCATLLSPISAFAQNPAYFRQPSLSGQSLVFASEGDLWVADLQGGEARRLTSHQGEEGWPVVSPDGKTVAFSAEYQGGEDVYIMPLVGGTPKRISWLEGRPVAWTPDGHVVVRTRVRSGLPQFRLVTVNTSDLKVTEVPLAEAAEGAYSPDGTLVFSRLPRQGSNSRFYKGGTAPKLWSFKAGDAEARPLTSDYPGSSRQPIILADGRVYFLSDRKDAMNIWSMLPNGSDLRQHTSFKDFDLQELAGSGQTLVFRMRADLYRLRVPDGQPEKIDLLVRSDNEQSLVEFETKPMDRLSHSAISHNGKQVALVSRGELFVAPAGAGRLVHLDPNSGVRYREAVFGPDSSMLYALSDASGEVEWWQVPVNGVGKAKQITDGPAILRENGLVSPDGKRLAHTNYNDGLWIVELKTGKTTRISDRASSTPAWSPDSRYLVFPKGVSANLDALFVYDTKDASTKQVTPGRFNDSRPAFSAKGDWLFFVSSRHWDSDVNSPWGERAPQPHSGKPEGIFAIPLRQNARWPFTPDNELLAMTPKDSSKITDPMRFDLVGHLRETPVKPGNFGAFLLGKDRLFYVDKEDELYSLELKAEAEPVKITSKVSSVDLSSNRETLLIYKTKGSKKLYTLKADAGKDAELDKAEVELKDWRFAVDKRAEWNQIYADAWRLHRDYFWDPNMHGVDWESMRRKYEPLLDRVGSRAELSDLQGMLVSELSLLHSNAGGGDTRGPSVKVEVGQLGAVFEKDSKAGGFRVVKRFEGHPDLPDTWSPLQRPDVRIEEGDLILAVNGRSLADVAQLESMLIDAADKSVLLLVKDKTTGRERSVLVKAASADEAYDLRYEDWERSRLAMVDSLSKRDIGYLHIQTMGKDDIGRFTRDFYNQLGKKGMIIDVRHNFGGNIDSWVLGQLMRRAWAYFAPRNMPADESFPNMQESFNGPLVVLVDHWTASDGEAFADGFTRLGLGHTIGTRTWGGEVWLSSSNRQVDGGIARASEMGVFGLDGKWLIEGWGFVPAQEVDNLPHATYEGKDAQLEAAVKHLQDQLSQKPATVPMRPAYPVLVPGQGYPTPYAGWDE